MLFNELNVLSAVLWKILVLLDSSEYLSSSLEVSHIQALLSSSFDVVGKSVVTSPSIS